ncbi:MAG: kelch repeat-containing protein [Candidatus Anstonellales archaeon]
MSLVPSISKVQVLRDPTKSYAISADTVYYDSNTTIKQYLLNFNNIAVNQIIYNGITLSEYFQYIENVISNLDSSDIKHPPGSQNTLSDYLSNLNTNQIKHGQYVLYDYLQSIGGGLGNITTADINHHNEILQNYLDSLDINDIWYAPGVTLGDFLSNITDPNFTIPIEYVLYSNLRDETPKSTEINYHYNFITNDLFYYTEDVSTGNRRFVLCDYEDYFDKSRIKSVYVYYSGMTRREDIEYFTSTSDLIKRRTITISNSIVLPPNLPPLVIERLSDNVTGDQITARRFHTMSRIYNFIMIFGGDDGVVYHRLGDSYIYNHISSEIIKYSTLNSGRIEHSMVEYNNKIYVFGGYGGEYSSPATHLNDLIEFDIFNNKWKIINTTGSPSPRMAHSAVVVGDNMYIFGGYNGSNFSNELWKYNFTSSVWTKLNPTGNLPPPRSEHISFVKDGDIYIGFGMKDHTFYTDLWKYDINTNTWTEIFNNAPYGTAGATCHCMGNNLYILFGRNLNDTFNTIIKCDLSSSNVSFNIIELDILPRCDHSSVEYDSSKIFIHGGFNGMYLRDMFIYNITDNNVRYIINQ